MKVVLIVDDEKADRTIAFYSLNDQGFQILEARDGQEALKIIHEQSQSIDLVFTDIKMPKMNGLELAEAIQSFAPQIKILFTSGCYFPEQFGHIPPELFLLKPYDPDALVRKINELIEGGKLKPSVT